MNGPGSLRLPLYVFIQNAQVCAASIMSLEGKVHFMADIGKAIKDGIDGAGKELGKAANSIGAKAGDAAGFIGGQLGELRDRSGEALKEAGDGLANIIDNITNHREGDGEHDSDHQKLDEYEVAIVEYNQAYTDMSDYGVRLHQERERSGDLLSLVEVLINSIANSPKEFQATFEEIRKDKAAFTEAEQYAKEELDAARQSAMSAGGGIAAGAAVASMAPTAAMWIATTFGTASTGTAISTLSGAAASQAALAWLGGGALAAGGAGTAGGSALLALAGPIGWGIAGATLLTSIILFARKSLKLKAKKQEELLDIKRNTAEVKGLGKQIESLLQKTVEIRSRLNEEFRESMSLFECDYTALCESEKARLGALVNNSKSLGVLMTESLGESE